MANDKDDDRGLEKGLTSYGDRGFSLFLRKAFIKGAGYSDAALDRPVIAIADTGSDYNPCHGNAAQLVEAVKRGVMLAGGLPMRFPTMHGQLFRTCRRPTSRRLRSTRAMATRTSAARSRRCSTPPSGCSTTPRPSARIASSTRAST